ncbi:MAG TPA: phosphoribosyltransferase domain-containing protein [Mycobacteriales bacterium]|nr:phosphoribosyltransferase domain-containing protein [Mycobacteriales bacterium]
MRSVVEQGLGLHWQVDADPYDLGLDALVGLALRDNPKRVQLAVSRVLGKHLPVDPQVALTAGRRLAALVGDVPAPLVLGYCETATGLGHVVAEALPGAHYVHTTRRPDPAVPATTGFDEEHSHAVAHTLQLRDPRVLTDRGRAVVLVDDELTTGTTALNTVAALQALAPHDRYVVATLLDLRTEDRRVAFAARAAELGVRVDVVALLSGSLALPGDVAERAAVLRAELARVPAAATPKGRGRVQVLEGCWPADLPTGGRTGVDAGTLDEPLAALAAAVGARLSGGPTLVLGTEELMWLPLRLAAALPGPVVTHSTTRSPVLAADLPGYAVRRVLRFPAPDEPGRTSRLHGLPDEPYADVVVVVDTPVVDAAPLAEALRPWATGSVLVVGL